jgi:AAA domain
MTTSNNIVPFPAETTDKPRGWRKAIFNAKVLQAMRFKTAHFLVPNLIPEGLTILAGRPKVGKSWLALDIALAVAGGRIILGDIKPESGDVLYCALEDSQRRLQNRLKRIAPGLNEWPERLTLTTEWRRLDDRGAEDIREWAREVSKPRLVILDTLASVRPERSGKETQYDGDYKALRELHAWANERGIAVLVLHHTRKQESEDPIDAVSGTLGLTGCADTTCVLSRSNNGGYTMYLRGRDVEEQELAMVFSKECCRWTILGDAASVHRSDAASRILTTLADAKELLSPRDISTATGLNRNLTDQQLLRLVGTGQVVKGGRGLYAHSERHELLTKDRAVR